MTELLDVAVKSGRVDVVKSFLSTLHDNSNPENDAVLHKILTQACVDGGTFLHLASKEDQFDIVRTLLAAGADPSVIDQDGHFPYDVAVSEKMKSVYREHLLQAVSLSNMEQTEKLIGSGISINFIDTPESCNTPLHWAASFAQVEMVECLCKHGADVHAINTAGCSPLHDAVVRGNRDIVYVLLKYGADATLQISCGKYAGKSCYDLAAEKPAVLEILNDPPRVTSVKIATLWSQTSVSSNGATKPLKLSLPNGSIAMIDDGTTPLAKKEPGISCTPPHLMSPVFTQAPAVDEVRKPPQVVTEEQLSYLWPQPHHIVQHEGSPLLLKNNTLSVLISVGFGSVFMDLKKQLMLHKPRFDALNVQILIEPLTPLSDLDEPHVVCHVGQRLCPKKDSYKLTIIQNQVKILCNNCDAFHFAIATLLQLMRIYRDKNSDNICIPQLIIDDWPDVTYRGILFDISQGRVPNMETFKEIVSTLAMMKINQVYLYTRFRNLEVFAWQICYSMEEITELDEYSHSFGIALCPVLEVAPTVQFDDIAAMHPVFQDFLTCFSFNEFVSVGPRLSSFMLDIDDNNDLHVTDYSTLLPVRSDQTLQLCGYPLHDIDQNLLSKLPPHLVFSEYGVQATHDYREICRPLANNGLSFTICPGTAAWNSLAGCPEAAITNVYNAVKCAVVEGAIGITVCNWSGKGHITHLPFSWPGFLMGAGLSWNSNCHWEFCIGSVEDLLNRHIFQAEKGVVGHAIVELGRAETYLLRCARCQTGEDCSDLPSDNGSLLYQFLLNPDSSLIENLTPEILQRVTRHVRKCQTELKTAEIHCRQGANILSELQHTCDLMLLAVKIGRALVTFGRNPNGQAGCDIVNCGVANLSATVKTDLANRLLELLEVYEKLWKQRYLEFGMKFSVTALQNVFKQFIPEVEPRKH